MGTSWGWGAVAGDWARPGNEKQTGEGGSWVSGWLWPASQTTTIRVGPAGSRQWPLKPPNPDCAGCELAQEPMQTPNCCRYPVVSWQGFSILGHPDPAIVPKATWEHLLSSCGLSASSSPVWQVLLLSGLTDEETSQWLGCVSQGSPCPSLCWVSLAAPGGILMALGGAWASGQEQFPLREPSRGESDIASPGQS